MLIDHAILQFDKALRTVFAPASQIRPTPGADLPEVELTPEEKRHVEGLMRVNHCGEICAQALYQGQALMSKDEGIKKALEQAGYEEIEHLAWTEQRIAEMGGRKSLLNPLWYAGAFTLGIIAGKCGDKWNLGFLAETERQVEGHLKSHMDRLPEQDKKSEAILEQMKVDEVGHAELAVQLGAHELPLPVKMAMKAMGKVMTRTAYYI